MINRPRQHLISLEVSDNYQEKNDYEKENESAEEDNRRPRRVTVLNADFIYIFAISIVVTLTITGGGEPLSLYCDSLM